MMTLTRDLFARRYDDLVTLGRSRLPGFAPEWTDHNAHDAGITLMELLAATAEAQFYSLSRMRRDERAAYARFMGVEEGSVVPASGLLWPDERDSQSPWATFAEGVVLDEAATIRLAGEEAPVYRVASRMLWLPARIERLAWRSRSGAETDLTARNRTGATAWLPFGPDAGARDVLVVEVALRGRGLGTGAKQAPFTLGIRAARSGAGALAEPPAAAIGRIEATLVEGATRIDLPVVRDTSAGLLRTGVLMLDLSAMPPTTKRLRIELRCPRGFVRPPAWTRIAPSVVPILQRETVDSEPHEVNQAMDFAFDLDAPGLAFAAADVREIALAFDDPSDGRTAWKRCERLRDAGPGDAVYELDESRGRVRFGNGVNGRAPRAGSPLHATYHVSAGEGGNVARNRPWRVDGFAGSFGVNIDPVGGGAAPRDDAARRRLSRLRARTAPALATLEDIIAAARELPLLGVARAWTVRDPAHPGTLDLVALREREGGEGGGSNEPARWLLAVQRALAPRMPLGTRLRVKRPRYVPLGVRVTVVTDAGLDPGKVKERIAQALAARLALVSARPGDPLREPGVPVDRHEVGGWIRAVEGVRAISSFALLDRRGRAIEDLAIPGDALPQLDPDRTSIEAVRGDAS